MFVGIGRKYGHDMIKASAKFTIGQVVRHRKYPFRGVIFDIDPTFSNTDEWWESIPEESRPSKEQPFYHLLAENDTSYYVAYVSEQEPCSRQQRRPCRPSRDRALFRPDD